MLGMQAISVASESRAMEQSRNRSAAETVERRILVTTWSRTHLGIVLETEFGSHLQELTKEFMLKCKLSHWHWTFADIPDASLEARVVGHSETTGESGDEEDSGGFVGGDSDEGDDRVGNAPQDDGFESEPEWEGFDEDENVGPEIPGSPRGTEWVEGGWDWEEETEQGGAQ